MSGLIVMLRRQPVQGRTSRSISRRLSSVILGNSARALTLVFVVCLSCCVALKSSSAPASENHLFKGYQKIDNMELAQRGESIIDAISSLLSISGELSISDQDRIAIRRDGAIAIVDIELRGYQ